MQVIALLRGVTPVGKNKIPKMSYLAEILQDSGFENVQTYIQSGNILLESDLSHSEIASKIHEEIYTKIGADLSIIIKTKEQLITAIAENPFDESYDFSRIHLVFTNSDIDDKKVKEIEKFTFEGELFYRASECFYLYLPRDVTKKKLNNNYLERKIGIVATTRKLNVIKRLCEMCD